MDRGIFGLIRKAERTNVRVPRWFPAFAALVMFLFIGAIAVVAVVALVRG